MANRKAAEDKLLKYDIKTRVNTREFQRLNKLLAASRYKTMSVMLREIISGRPLTVYTRDESLDIMMGELTRLRKELNAIGVNINQAVRKINSPAGRDERVLYLLELTAIYQSVEAKTAQIYPVITELAKRWLQK